MQKLQLSIPEPCHENWQQMTPTGQGRFCNACIKEVIDFSTMTDMQVLNYFSTLTNEKVCGRALPEQLNRTISRPSEPKKRLFWYWNYIVMFFMFFGKGNTVKAQGGIKPVTEFSAVKTNDIRGKIAVGGVKRESSRVISGKVTDIDGNPVSFASIKIKGSNTGISADANGAYSIRANSNDVLVISGASFKSLEEPVGARSVINIVLAVAFAGGISYWNLDEDYASSDKIKAVAILKVKDEESGKFLPKATVVINSDLFTGTVYTDAKGVYKIKAIKKYDNYFIKVTADGYEANEFTISETDFKDRKKEWEVLLRKQKVETTKPIAAVKPGTTIRLACRQGFTESKGALYVVDGIISINTNNVNPDDIEEINVLQAPAAAALFGPDGVNGAIVITTRKAKEKSLKEVEVTSDYGVKRTKGMTGMMSVTGAEVNITNPQKDLVTEADDQLRIYPNPVARGNTFNITLKLKQTGHYQIQITDAAARTVLQKQIIALTKDFTEKIPADNRWSSGVYYVSLIDNKNKLINKSSFLLQ